VSVGPRVSIIINNFNYARFLRDAIDSALSQTYPNTEVIVVDDGSTDSSVQVITDYGDTIIPILKENGGQGSAYNAGYARSTGQVVCFLDSDDTLLPGAIAAAVPRHNTDEVVKVQWPMFVTDGAGQRFGRVTTMEPPPDGLLIERVVEEGPLYDFNYHTNCTYSRRVLDHVMPVPEQSYRHGADVYLTTLAPVYGVLETLPCPFGTYRLHGENNYAQRPLDDARLRDYVSRFETNAEHLAKHLRSEGRGDVDPERWRATAFNYLWPTRLLAARQHLEQIVPSGAVVILVDGGDCGDVVLPGRRVVPILEKDGKYWGPPEDDDHALRELNRLRRDGASHVAVWWTARWWPECYPLFWRHLRANTTLLLNDESVMILELQPLEAEVV
jgi:glycosyltransferase involved in cell wall biosynthesis